MIRRAYNSLRNRLLDYRYDTKTDQENAKRFREKYAVKAGKRKSTPSMIPFFKKKAKKKLTQTEYDQLTRDFLAAHDAYSNIDLQDAIDTLSKPGKDQQKLMEDESETFGQDVDVASRVLLHMKRDKHAILDRVRGTYEGFVEFDPESNAIVISFKGSSVAADWGADLQSAFADTQEYIYDKEGNVLETLPLHIRFNSGFWERFENLYETMKQGLISVLKSLGLSWESETLPYEIRINGHSLGGALAEICGTVLQLLHPEWDIKISTFAPAEALSSIGDGVMEDYTPLSRLNDAAQRYTTRGDVVNKAVPFGSHVGRHNNRLPGWSHPGSHSRANIYGKVLQLDPNLPNPASITQIEASGLIRPTHKPTIKKSSAAMKAKMAYVRSFKKK